MTSTHTENLPVHAPEVEAAAERLAPVLRRSAATEATWS